MSLPFESSSCTTCLASSIAELRRMLYGRAQTHFFGDPQSNIIISHTYRVATRAADINWMGLVPPRPQNHALNKQFDLCCGRLNSAIYWYHLYEGSYTSCQYTHLCLCKISRQLKRACWTRPWSRIWLVLGAGGYTPTTSGRSFWNAYLPASCAIPTTSWCLWKILFWRCAARLPWNLPHAVKTKDGPRLKGKATTKSSILAQCTGPRNFGTVFAIDHTFWRPRGWSPSPQIISQPNSPIGKLAERMSTPSVCSTTSQGLIVNPKLCWIMAPVDFCVFKERFHIGQPTFF